MFKVFFAVSSLFAVVSAQFPGPYNHFVRVKLNGVRSPCPAINILANHGFVNRDGRDVPLDGLAKQLAAVFPVTATFPLGPIGASRRAGLLHTTAAGVEVLSIDRLHEHNELEHDASFSRVDQFFAFFSKVRPGAGFDPDRSLIHRLCAPGASTLSVLSLISFQRNRIRESLAYNPEATFTDEGKGGMSAQGTLLVALGQRTQMDYVDKKRACQFLGEERIPDGYDPANLPADFELISFAAGSRGAIVRAKFAKSIESATSRGGSLFGFSRFFADLGDFLGK